MKRLNWQIAVGVVSVVSSALLYTLHFYIFRDAHHIFIFMFGDIAFIPIEGLLVTLIIHQVFSLRENKLCLIN